MTTRSGIHYQSNPSSSNSTMNPNPHGNPAPNEPNDGSVQHLDILDQNEKDVFKTAMEIDQRWVVEHAADRQQFIDQGQSVNLFFRPDADVLYLHAVHFAAWKGGVKSLYYCRSDKIGKADKIAKRIEREIIKEIDLKAIAEGEECLACEG